MISVFCILTNPKCPKPHHTQSEPFATSRCTFAINTIGHNNNDDDENERRHEKED